MKLRMEKDEVDDAAARNEDIYVGREECNEVDEV
jgi:hypothetical protein